MKIDLQGRTKLAFFQDLYNEARTFSDEMYEKLDQHLKQYKGDKKIDGSDTEATQVRNITYELVEISTSSYVMLRTCVASVSEPSIFLSPLYCLRCWSNFSYISSENVLASL